MLLGALAAAPAAAEIVLFTHGDWLKVRSFQLLDQDRVRLELPDGGTLVVSLLAIERILDDEIVPRAQLEEVIAEPEARAFSVRFTGQPPPEGPFADQIYAAARRHRLNPALVAAVVRAESAYATGAVSRKGARGLMQLMPATAARFGLSGKEIFDPIRNLDAGCRYLSWLVDRFDGRLPLVLAAYNAGEGAVARHGGVPPYRETRDYIARIYAFLGLDHRRDAR